MLRLLSTAMLAGCLVVPASAKSKPPAPRCETLAQSIASGKAIAEQKGYGFATLDGAQAKVFLDQINSVGQPSSFKADHVGLFIAPATDTALILLSDGKCGGFSSMFRMHIRPVLEAYSKARGAGA